MLSLQVIDSIILVDDAVTKSIRIRRVQTAIREHVYVTKGF